MNNRPFLKILKYKILPQTINTECGLWTLLSDSKFSPQTPHSVVNAFLGCLQPLSQSPAEKVTIWELLKGDSLGTESSIHTSGWIAKKLYHLDHIILTHLELFFSQAVMECLNTFHSIQKMLWNYLPSDCF